MKLYEVTEDICYSFIKDNNLAESQSDTTHGSNFVNDTGDIMAYIESSSYGASTVYKIADASFVNLKNLITIGKIINNKL